jgi:tripartite-type tricarboxylate transporter receptor subunit TctC
VTNIALGAGYLMVANNNVPAKSLKELVALAKTRTLRYSTAGVGNGQHLAGALLASKIGAEMIHVPYKGGGPAMIAVLGGETEVHYPAPAVGVTHVKAGKVRALGFTGAKRLAALPDVPTIGEVVPVITPTPAGMRSSPRPRRRSRSAPASSRPCTRRCRLRKCAIIS